MSDHSVTLLRGDVSRATRLTGLPSDLLVLAARRLRTLALLYAFVFVMANPLPALAFPAERAAFLGTPLRWAPPTLSILVALLVVAMTWSRRIDVSTTLAVGLVFQVVAAYGIALAQYLDPARYATMPPWAGLSWVAVWVLSFAVMIPSPPRHTLIASIAAASSVPVVVGLVMASGPPAIQLPPLMFFLRVLLPYALVVIVAYLGARTIYRLGAELRRARELGSYRLVERLGIGGMGEVWRARHRLLARPAAVKLMRPEVLGASSVSRHAELVARFEREAQATASMSSPHTIELYDFGVTDEGTFYYVMELLEGFDLDTLVRRFGPVPPERAVHLLLQVCHSLAEAHDAGLVHRDIKPANVYACRYGRDVDFVKVLDFGLVKSEQELGETQIDLTVEHGARGTPAFMSPEQVLGDRPMDGRSDIYATGCVAYWLITGRHLFEGRTAMQTMMQQTQSTPVPPSQRSPFPVPEALDRLVLDCLEKDPASRPATADILAERLTALGIASQWTPARMRTWWDEHRPEPPGATVGSHTDLEVTRASP